MKLSEKNMPELLTLKEAAATLKCHPNTLRLWDKDGTLKMVRFGKNKLIRYKKSDILNLLEIQEFNKKTIASSSVNIAEFIKKNANKIRKIAIKERKKYAGTANLRREKLHAYISIHIEILHKIADNLNQINQSIPVFKALGEKLAEQAVKDNLTLEEAVDGTVFMKQTIWRLIEERQIHSQLTVKDMADIGKAISVFSDVVASRIAFAYHNAYKKSLDQELEQQRQTASKLEDSLNRFESLVENIPDIIIRFDKKLRRTYINSAIADITGTSQKIYLGKSKRELTVPLKLVSYWNKMLRNTFETGKDTSFDFTLTSGSKTSYYHTVLAPEKDTAGKVISIMAISRDVTELIDKDRQSAFLLNVLENVTDSIIVTDLKGKITYWNDGAENIFGYSSEEMLGKTPAKLYPEISPIRYGADLNTIKKEGEYRGEWMGKRKDGKEIWINIKTTLLKDSGDKPVGFIGVSHDITNYKKTNDALNYQSYINRTITSNATLALFMMDSKQHCTFMNPAAEYMTGFKLSEVQGKPLHDFIHHKYPDGKDYPISQCPIDRVLPQNDREHGEEIFIRKDGSLYPVSFTASPIRERDKPVGTIIEVRDTTEDKKKEEALRKSEMKFQELADSMPQLVWTADPDGKVDYYNKKRHDFDGISKKGQEYEWGPLVHPDDIKKTLTAWQLSMTTGSLYEIEHRVKMKGGKYRWFLSRGIPVRGSNKKILKWYGTATDIHEQKESEYRFITTLKNSPITVAQIDSKARYVWVFNPDPAFHSEDIIGKTDAEISEGEDGAKKLYELKNTVLKTGKKIVEEITFNLPDKTCVYSFAIEPIIEGKKVTGLTTVAFDITQRKLLEKEKDTFIGVASHELKTPLTTMKAFAQILRKRCESRGDDKDKYLVEQVNSQTDRLTKLINDLLNLSKIESGQLEFDKRKFDLNHLISKILTDFQYTVDTRNIALEGSLKKLVYGDESRIEQVISNLLTHAVKYSPVDSKIIIKIQSLRSQALICVQDFGMGISKRDQQRLFERFYRTNDKNKHKKEGFGLGLYISAEIVKRHGGDIWVKSQKGKGSTFCFTIPFNSVKSAKKAS